MHNLNLSRKNIPFTNVASNSIIWLSARLEAVTFLVILKLWKSSPLNPMLISKQSHQQLNWLQVDQSQLFLKTENKIVCEETSPPSAVCLSLDTLRSTTWAKNSSASDWGRTLGNYQREIGKGEEEKGQSQARVLFQVKSQTQLDPMMSLGAYILPPNLSVSRPKNYPIIIQDQSVLDYGLLQGR